MKRLGEFFKKHTDNLEKKSDQIAFIQEVLKNHKLSIPPQNISYKNKTLFINTSAIQKSEIISQKDAILKELSLKVKDIQEIK